MIQTNSEIRTAARAFLEGHWGEAVLLTLVFMAIACGCSLIPYVGSFIALIFIPMSWAYEVAFLDHVREAEGAFALKGLVRGYKDFARIFLTVLLVGVYTLLWSLLLFVPGVIKSFSYALTPFILADRPELKYNGAIELSIAMMEGHKMDLFLLYLSFIGWGLLCVLTLGIGALWLYPYMNTSLARFYEEVKREYEERCAGQQ